MNKRLLAAALLLACSLAGCSKETEELEPPSQEIQQENQQEIQQQIQQEPVEPQKPTPVSVRVDAEPVSVGAYIDGKNVNLKVYQINGSNFLSLHDIAVLLNGSRVQYDFGWDNASNTTLLTSGEAYKEASAELGNIGNRRVTAWSNTAPLLLDGEEIFLENYTIDGTDYFSLREIAETLDFSLGWIADTKKITVNTSKHFGEEPLTAEEEYQLLLDRPMFVDGLWGAKGLCYADYIDFDNDGSPELLTASTTYKSTGVYSTEMEIYGIQQGHAVSLGKLVDPFQSLILTKLSLYESSGKIFLGFDFWGGGSGTQTESVFYGVVDHALSVVDAVGGIPGSNHSEVGYYTGNIGSELASINDYTDPDTNGFIAASDITRDQYNAIMDKYTETEVLSKFQIYDFSEPPFWLTCGILS